VVWIVLIVLSVPLEEVLGVDRLRGNREDPGACHEPYQDTAQAFGSDRPTHCNQKPFHLTLHSKLLFADLSQMNAT
jgi:hypothetical protein